MLIGLRGSGKTTIGKRLARTLGRLFVDLDDRTPALLGTSTAAEAINTHGLAAFRAAEHDALDAILRDPGQDPLVVSLGGGTPTAPGADDLLRSARAHNAIRMVYLHASPSTLRDRLRATDTATRPSLTGTDMLDEIETVYLQRDGLYRSIADRVVETGELSENEVVALLVEPIAE